LDDPVEQNPSCWREALDAHRSQRIEANLHENPAGFQERAAEDFCLDSSGHVSIDTLSSLVGMVVKMVPLENNAVGEDDGQVSKHAEEGVLMLGWHGQVMCDLMDGQEQPVGRSCSDDIGYNDEGEPRVLVHG